MLNTNRFRYDINGLRAYAVLLVVLYHFQIVGFSAGFIGVDIFFVISGYLMTKIITDGIIKGKLSIWKFYLARGIRIIPALLLLTLTMALIGWFLIIPEEYTIYGKHAVSSITFLSNIFYWKESGGYFSPAAHDNILLHTWSLSVEWQFYIILPIVLLCISKIKKDRSILNLVILLGFIISLILSYKISQYKPTVAFYTIPTRAWEMLAGGLVYAYFSNIIISEIFKKLIEVTGFSLIIISLIIFDSTTVWPGINAALPVFGSMLILVSNRVNSIFTKPNVLQFIGSSSYSIYLWHWPIIFFILYFSMENNSFILGAGIASSIVIGWVSYRFVETPTRSYLTNISSRKSCAILMMTTISLTLVFTLIILTNGFPGRANQDYYIKSKDIAMPLPSNGWCFYSIDTIRSLTVGENGLNCYVGKSKDFKHKALLFGDSFAGHNIPFWDIIGKKLETQIHSVTTNWCYPALDDEFTGRKSSPAYEQCKFNRGYLSENMQKYDYLIFSGMWDSVNKKNQMNSFDFLLAEANKLNIPVIIMASPYSFSRNIGNLYKNSIWNSKTFNISNYINDDYDSSRKQSNSLVEIISKKYKNVIFLNENELYSNDHLTERGYPYSIDGDHLSILGSKSSAKYFEKTTKFKELQEKIN
ncbi:acyltransferase family protein [Klebsiella sp. BIGb0407]|uniref:acyltransferase family protein n=1 Tax=Klebsiella sp. BIGb0407 TaxID=2940603 RepID=UPI00216972A1|nr:acyltransferase family protein [Klebsiella sp. BIGb0407]MCS3430531.1 peptidoglycan/LPS O-acetylase OafA/YrhL [Klebsiella sp. BIGb0407]